jgi:hypothetical protein
VREPVRFARYWCLGLVLGGPGLRPGRRGAPGSRVGERPLQVVVAVTGHIGRQSAGVGGHGRLDAEHQGIGVAYRGQAVKCQVLLRRGPARKRAARRPRRRRRAGPSSFPTSTPDRWSTVAAAPGSRRSPDSWRSRASPRGRRSGRSGRRRAGHVAHRRPIRPPWAAIIPDLAATCGPRSRLTNRTMRSPRSSDVRTSHSPTAPSLRNKPARRRETRHRDSAALLDSYLPGGINETVAGGYGSANLTLKHPKVRSGRRHRSTQNGSNSIDHLGRTRHLRIRTLRQESWLLGRLLPPPPP